jgi:chemotaxis protein methyltransferase CheR
LPAMRMLRAAVKWTEYNDLCGLLRARCGLGFSGDRRDLMASRLRPLVVQAGVADLGGLVAKLKARGSEALMAQVVDAMLPHDTAFFRDANVFRNFSRNLLPALLDTHRVQRRIRIWCAGAATGQEPYSLAMILADMQMTLSDWHVDLVATDLSRASLTRAREGSYSQAEVQCGLPIDLLLKHFQPDGDGWRIAADLRAMVRFEQANLLDDFSGLGVFDVIFCRHVLSGLDQAARRDVLGRIVGAMTPNGYLLLDDGETTMAREAGFVSVRGMSGVYTRKPAFMAMSGRGSAGRSRPVAPYLTVVATNG